MKTAVALALALATLLIGWLLWRHPTQDKVAALQSRSPKTNVVDDFAPPPTVPRSVSRHPTDWQAMRSVRETTLQEHPELVAEYKSLLSERDQQQMDLDSAIVRADPSAAPIVAKLNELRKKSAANSPTPEEPPSSLASISLLPAEWRHFRTARSAALKTNPLMMAKAGRLSEKFQNFETRLNAAMIKSDPSIATILEKLSGKSPIRSDSTLSNPSE